MLKYEPVFPTFRTVAEMRPHSQTVHLEEISAAAFHRKLNIGDFIGLAGDLEVILHELTHWFDLVGTVWGQEYLDMIYAAYDVLLRPSEDTNNFWRLIELFDEDRRILLPRYYHTVAERSTRHSIRRPWQIRVSAGLEFTPDGHLNTDRPIFFVIFGDHDTAVRQARQPLTAGSLLETCAVWSEMATFIETVAQLPPDVRAVETSLWSGRKTELLYELAYTQYVAPAHLLSVQVGTGDPVLTYERASALARVCLNLTTTHFNALRHPAEFDWFDQRRRDAFVANQDRGYAFAAIVYQAPRYEPAVDTEAWLSLALQESGLPDVDALRRDALAHLDVPPASADQDPQIRGMRDNIWRIGRDISVISGCGRMNGFTYGRILENQIPTPRMFDADLGYLIFPTVIDIGDHNPEFLFDAQHRLREATQKLLIGCRGFPEH